ncbi:hypothetical protein BH10PSE11_BH10PSE11_35840 [soil metagenome]
MRRFMLAAVAALAFAGIGLMVQSRAEAMPLAGGLAGTATGQAENVAVVCNPVWNGYAWVRTCYQTAPRYYAPRPYYGYGYGGGYYRPRARYYRYY